MFGVSDTKAEEKLILRRITQKLKFCHHSLTLKLLQTCMSFFLQLNTQEDILKNNWNQTVVWHHWLPL